MENSCSKHAQKSQPELAMREGGGRKFALLLALNHPFPGNGVGCADARGIPRRLSQAAIPSVPGESEAQHWHTASLWFSWEGRAKRSLWMAAPGTQFSAVPSLTFPFSLFSFLFLLDCKFHSSWKGPKYNCWICTEKATIVE